MGHRQSPILNDNKLKLGFFSPNCGMAVTKAPERWVNSWENNIRLAQLGDWDHDGPFDHEGKFYNLKGIYGYPRPFDSKPPIMNAAGSQEGRQFATRNADFLFCIFTLAHVVCRPIQKEAEEYLHYYADELADWDAVDNLMRLQGMHAQSFPAEALEMLRGRFAAGHGTYPLVGDPDHIASELAKVPNAEFTGCTLSFVDYAKEFPYFRDEVIPRLEKMGLRNPANRPG